MLWFFANISISRKNSNGTDKFLKPRYYRKTLELILNPYFFFFFKFDFDNIPDEKYQKWWIGEYLTEYMETNEITPATINQWSESVQLMTPLSHLLWGTWALVQLEKSAIDFDYANYAMDRLKCYFELKKTNSIPNHLSR